MSQLAITYTPPRLACTICCEPEQEDGVRIIFRCITCGDPVCGLCSEATPNGDAWVCKNCVAEGKSRRPRVAKFRLDGKLDGADGFTVTIDLGAGTFSVRPKRRKRAYTLPLQHVAERVVHSIIRGETLAKQKARKQRRKLRRKR